ncbi:22575_t:CDS:1, partial [Racocetra persica]
DNFNNGDSSQKLVDRIISNELVSSLHNGKQSNQASTNPDHNSESVPIALSRSQSNSIILLQDE